MNDTSSDFNLPPDTMNAEELPPLLPRSAWTSQVAYLRAIFRAKKALDRIEQEAFSSTHYSPFPHGN